MSTAIDSNGKPLRHKHYYPQVWLLVVSFSVFALLVAWDLGLLRMVAALDRSYVTSIIFGLLVLSTCHAAWHIFKYSTHIETALSAPGSSTINALIQPGYNNTASSDHKAQLEAAIEIAAEKYRAPVDLGWFLVDLAIRLGLVGTIIGFILIFTSLSSVSIDGADGLKELMVAMSGGMGTALFTTLGGLIAGTIMSFQYLVLGRQTEYLIGVLITATAHDTAV